MSETANLEQLRADLPVDRIAERIGADPAATAAAIDTLLPSLVGGLSANARDPQRAASLADALGEHGGSDPGDIDPSQIDVADGQKIVRNIFGDNTDEVVHRLGSASGGDSIVRKLLPILAPIVLSWLASQLAGKPGGSDQQQGQSPEQGGSGGLGGVVGQILSGVLAGGAAGGLGEVLGSVLGNTRPSGREQQEPAGVPGGDSTSSVRMPDVFGKAGQGEPVEPASSSGQAAPAGPADPGAASGGTSLDDLLGDLLGKGKR